MARALWPTNPNFIERFSTRDVAAIEDEFRQEEKALFLRNDDEDNSVAGTDSDDDDDFDVTLVEFHENSEHRLKR
jgi:hypothetical protein